MEGALGQRARQELRELQVLEEAQEPRAAPAARFSQEFMQISFLLQTLDKGELAAPRELQARLLALRRQLSISTLDKEQAQVARKVLVARNQVELKAAAAVAAVEAGPVGQILAFIPLERQVAERAARVELAAQQTQPEQDPRAEQAGLVSLAPVDMVAAEAEPAAEAEQVPQPAARLESVPPAAMVAMAALSWNGLFKRRIKICRFMRKYVTALSSIKLS